ncbi:uncharacterized protein LOC112507131 isoform X2 [Cynara cardunculus var. scolymus]|uniref:uncharacterized protein LOC112507131 isoform X2 n=1 Tax=Cynara cardunculus var. scolymus TaxID=59895 RepID=UPI000D6260D6|nr:uncharacterized protein LOC112507131 isoform X2 [Cynara cardunculus var. scolymus]
MLWNMLIGNINVTMLEREMMMMMGHRCLILVVMKIVLLKQTKVKPTMILTTHLKMMLFKQLSAHIISSVEDREGVAGDSTTPYSVDYFEACISRMFYLDKKKYTTVS